jgi:hypothetical protein
MSDRASPSPFTSVSREPPISAHLRRIEAAFDRHAASIEHLRRLLFLMAIGYFINLSRIMKQTGSATRLPQT